MCKLMYYCFLLDENLLHKTFFFSFLFFSHFSSKEPNIFVVLYEKRKEKESSLLKGFLLQIFGHLNEGLTCILVLFSCGIRSSKDVFNFDIFFSVIINPCKQRRGSNKELISFYVEMKERFSFPSSFHSMPPTANDLRIMCHQVPIFFNLGSISTCILQAYVTRDS